jgi:hypothetical protein
MDFEKLTRKLGIVRLILLKALNDNEVIDFVK